MPQNSIERFDEQYYSKHEEYQSLVRIRGTSVDGSYIIDMGLSRIRGVGRRLAQALVHVLKLDPLMRTGLLTEEQVIMIENAISDPIKVGVPRWMVNRPKDRRTGEDRHVSGTDILLVKKHDVDRMKKIRSWKGIRHMYGLKVRGQRTRTTGRGGLVIGFDRTAKKGGKE